MTGVDAVGPETRAYLRMRAQQERLRGEDARRRELHDAWLSFGAKPWWWQLVHRRPRLNRGEEATQ